MFASILNVGLPTPVEDRVSDAGSDYRTIEKTIQGPKS